MQKKQQNRELQAKFLIEAQKSKRDPVTGRVRCLSCGNVFRNHNEIAAHIQKHEGINSPEFKQKNIVGCTLEGKMHTPAARPTYTLSLNTLIQNSKPKFKNPQKQRSKACNQDKNEVKEVNTEKTQQKKETRREIGSRSHGRFQKQKNLTPVKRRVLIDRALSLTEALKLLEKEICDSECDVNIKSKDKKKLHGRKSCLELEFHHVLVAINQKFSLRQIVMLEFLVGEMQDAEKEGIENDKICEECCDDALLQLYDELEQFDEDMEIREQKETGHIFIKKPSFLKQPDPLSVMIPPHQPAQVVALASNVTIEKCDKNAATIDEEEDSASSSSDDGEEELWGFGDVLNQWAKKAQHKQIHQIQEHQSHNLPIANTPLPKKEIPESNTYGSTSVKLVYVKKHKLNNHQEANSTENESMQTSPQTYFIRPHLMEHTDQKSSNERLSKSERKVAQTETNPESSKDIVYIMLKTLNTLQYEEMQRSKSRKWMISGFSEVGKALQNQLLNLIILANNLDSTFAAKEEEIQSKASALEVPVIHALTRKKLGQIYHPRKKMSIIGILKSEESQSFIVQLKKQQAQS